MKINRNVEVLADVGAVVDRTYDLVVDALKADGATPEHQDQYLGYNKRLYESARWEEGNKLAVEAGDALTSSR